MENMERQKFEESLKDAFKKAEVNPSHGVWTNIELDLEKARAGQLKRRLMFYQMLAAAAVIFAIAIGGAGYYFNFQLKPSDSGNLAAEATRVPQAQPLEPGQSLQPVKPSDTRHTLPDGNNAPVSAENSRNATRENNAASAPGRRGDGDHQAARHLQRGVAGQGDANFPVADAGNSAALATGEERNVLPDLPMHIDGRNLLPFYTPRSIALRLPSKEEEVVDPVVAMLARLEQREKEVQGEEKNKKQLSTDENLWTSVGFAAGSFNSLSGSAPRAASHHTAMALAAPVVDQETKASGYSYSMGLNVGTRISERWVLQGGVNYLTHSSEYTADNVVVSSTSYQQQRFRAMSTNELINADEQELSSKMVYSAPYNVNNSMRYLSIPMQAGYLLVNKTFGLQLNAGIATDLFLQNTIKADSDQLEQTSQSGGSDSPYRSVNLSGLLGTEVSYRFNENYRISLNPGLRYPFNTIYKSELGVQSTPLTFDIGLRFRYIFH